MRRHPRFELVPLPVVLLSLWGPALAQSPATTIQSNQAGIRYGFHLAGPGDVNGDGYDDLLSSAPLFANGESNEGAVYLNLGSSSGVKQLPAWSFEADQIGALLGEVAWCGDMNQDGFDDLFLGSEEWDDGETDEGRVFLFYGSPTGPGSVPDWAHSPDQAFASYGACLGSAGDVNGDGFLDLFVGAPDWDGSATDQGKLYVHHGSSLGPLSEAWSVSGKKSFASFGEVAAGVGDVNGDGYDDLLMGRPTYTVPSLPGLGHGRVLLYLGSAAGLSNSFDWRFDGDQPNARFGFAMAGVGDVNGDGFDDFVVGAPDYEDGHSDEGRVYGFFGSPSGPGNSPDWVVQWQGTNAQFAYEVAGVGDVNFDGFPDVGVGSISGIARVFFGGPNGLSVVPLNYPSMGVSYSKPFSYFGNEIAGLGDVNGDGQPDYSVSANGFGRPAGHEDEGAVFVYHGSDDALAWRRWDRGLVNPWSYSANPPVLGETWSAVVDLTTTGHGSAFIVGHQEPNEQPLPGGQVWLVDGQRLFTLPWRSGPSAAWAIRIPNDPSLAGLPVYTQAVHVVGAQPWVLSNAMDLVVGY